MIGSVSLHEHIIPFENLEKTQNKNAKGWWQEWGVGKKARQSECDWYECHIVPGECEGESLHSQRKQGRVSF